MESPDSWSMTVVRMQGMQALRSDTRWRPEVSISFDGGFEAHRIRSHTFVLGVDGRNPNLKTLVSIPEISPGSPSRLSIEVFCRAPTASAKKREKAAPVCFALVPLSDLFRKRSDSLCAQRRFEHEVALIRANAPRGTGSAMTPQKPHETVPKLVLRFHAPEDPVTPLAPRVPSPGTLGSEGGSDTVVPSDCEAGPSSSPTPTAKVPAAFKARGNLRKRSVDTAVATTSAPTCAPRSGSVHVASQPAGHHESSSVESTDRQDEGPGSRSARTWLRFAERCVNYLGPYDELREAEERSDDRQTELVLARLVTEWQSVGQMLVGLAAINTAVVGFMKGSTTFTIDDFSLGAVTIGAIAAGLGMAMDAWFFFLFSGADVAKFKRLAKDVYGTYFFFSLVCRLPTMHMFVSVLALGLFLLSTAWVHSPRTALVVFCVFGVLVGSQMLACVLRVRCMGSGCGGAVDRRLRPRRTMSVLRMRRMGQAASHRHDASSPSPRNA